MALGEGLALAWIRQNEYLYIYDDIANVAKYSNTHSGDRQSRWRETSNCESWELFLWRLWRICCTVYTFNEIFTHTRMNICEMYISIERKIAISRWMLPMMRIAIRISFFLCILVPWTLDMRFLPISWAETKPVNKSYDFVPQQWPPTNNQT